MKLWIILLLVMSPAHAVETDKVKHFIASSAIGALSQHVFNDYRYSAIACPLVGAVKELTDAKFDKYDMFANVLGCATGILTYRATGYILNIKPISHGAKVEIRLEF